ncbi:MAG: hypothetical protein CMH50_02170 [Myxococcales bacterium]|nr:hypothetical protein [Myxococcales bacterium]
MAKQREEDAVFVGFESNLPTARVQRSRDDQSLGPPPVDPDLVAAALAEAEAAASKEEAVPSAEAVDEDELDEEEAKGKSWIKWLVIAVVVAVVGYFAYTKMQSEPEPAPAEATRSPKKVDDSGQEDPPVEEPSAEDKEEAP